MLWYSFVGTAADLPSAHRENRQAGNNAQPTALLLVVIETSVPQGETLFFETRAI